jgi:hypothetical protein
MKAYHWLVWIVVVVVAYYAGSKGWLTKAKEAVSGGMA